MAKGWTCGRCSAANPESAISCQACGLIRGGVVAAPAPLAAPPSPSWPTSAPVAPPPGFGQAVPVDGPPAPPPPLAGSPVASSELVPPAGAALWAEPAKPIPRSRGMLAARLAGIAAIILVGLAYAYVNNAGRSSSGEINKAGELAPSDLRVGDCFDLADPAASVVSKTTARPCSEPHQYEVFYAGSPTAGEYPTESFFADFTVAQCGPAFEAYIGVSYQASTLDVYTFYPNSQGWSQGDHVVQCSVYDPSNSTVTGSLKGANR